MATTAQQITATLQLGDKVFNIEGTIEGTTASAMVVTVTKVMRNEKDITDLWALFDDAYKFESALKDAYIRNMLQVASERILAATNELENARRALTNW